jgi:predicted HTH transcriptional regulator
MMTSRDFYNFVLSNVSDDSVKEFALHKLAQMDATNAKRVSKPSKRAIENEPIKAKILENIGQGCTASEIAPKLEISVQKASALLRQLVTDGTLTAIDVKVPKKGMMKFYRPAEIEDPQYLDREIAE